MRDYFTTGDLARDAKKTRQQIWNLWIDGRLTAAELIYPRAGWLRFKRTRRLQDWCSASAQKADKLAAKRRTGKYRFWTQYHEELLARLVKRKNPNLHSDLVSFRLWKELSIRNRLIVYELNRSFRRGVVTRIKSDEKDIVPVGVQTWIALRYDFDLLRKQIGESWSEWLPEEKTQVRDKIRPIVEFYNQLGGKGNDFT